MHIDILKKNMLQDLFNLENKVAVITGASGGIGRVLSIGLSNAGADIALCDICIEKTPEIEEEITKIGRRAESLYLDLSKKESIDNVISKIKERFGRIDILINCAAINKREPILDVEEDVFENIMSVNLKGLYQISQAVAPIMISQGAGKIINIGSINSEMALKNVSVYGAAKAAVKQLTMVMAIEWVDYNIQVNCIIPGFMYTPLSESQWKDEKKKAWFEGRIAMKRPGRPEELLGMAIYLSSNASSYMTGQSVIIDGGVMAGGTSW